MSIKKRLLPVNYSLPRSCLIPEANVGNGVSRNLQRALHSAEEIVIEFPKQDFFCRGFIQSAVMSEVDVCELVSYHASNATYIILKKLASEQSKCSRAVKEQTKTAMYGKTGCHKSE